MFFHLFSKKQIVTVIIIRHGKIIERKSDCISENSQAIKDVTHPTVTITDASLNNPLWLNPAIL
jgi:hypothetical protein